jgi:hypothetical protein
VTSPIDAVVAIHNAFRADIASIDEAALGAARGQPGLEETVDRFRLMNEVLVWHADGEEQGMFVELEGVAPCVAEAYERDHRALDAAFDRLTLAVTARDALETARATAAFRYYLDVHLAKEDAHLYRIIRERVSVADQAKAVGVMAGGVPHDRFPEFVGWLYPLMGDQDRENMTRVWQMLMPADAFTGACGLIQQAIGEDYGDLALRIPELVAS